MQKPKIKTFRTQEELNSGISMVAARRDVEQIAYRELHRHDYMEIEYIQAGSGIQTLNGTRYALKKGNLYILRPADIHAVSSEGRMVYYNLGFSETHLPKDILDSLISYNGNLLISVPPSDMPMLQSLFEILIQETRSRKPSIEILNHILECIILKIMRYLPLRTKETVMKTPIQNALTYLQMHFMENPSLQQVADIAHYNGSHFSHCFHEQMNMTYSDYISMLKINFAKKLLVSSDFKINDIGQRCGFLSHSNFLRTFRAKTGTSPRQYRISVMKQDRQMNGC